MLSNKTIILEIPKEVEKEDINWELIESYNQNIDFIICLHNVNLSFECTARKIKWYWAYPITSWFELKGLAALGPSYLLLGAPLCFELDSVSALNIPIRLVPNVAYDAYIPRTTGINGQWIRPEATDLYEKYVGAFEFIANSLTHEATLLHIYKDNKTWPGNLNLLFTNFGYNVDNRGLPEDLDKRRMNCRQICMSTGTCRLCNTAMRFSRTITDIAEKRT